MIFIMIIGIVLIDVIVTTTVTMIMIYHRDHGHDHHHHHLKSMAGSRGSRHVPLGRLPRVHHKAVQLHHLLDLPATVSCARRPSAPTQTPSPNAQPTPTQTPTQRQSTANPTPTNANQRNPTPTNANQRNPAASFRPAPRKVLSAKRSLLYPLLGAGRKRGRLTSPSQWTLGLRRSTCGPRAAPVQPRLQRKSTHGRRIESNGGWLNRGRRRHLSAEARSPRDSLGSSGRGVGGRRRQSAVSAHMRARPASRSHPSRCAQQ